MKNIKDSITEAIKEDYVVCFVGLVDKDGLPVKCTLEVPRTETRDFENFAENEKDSIFVHVVGGSLSF